MAKRKKLRREKRTARTGFLRRGFATSRDAMAAMIVVRAVERASELAQEDGSPALKRALAAAKKPLAEYIARQQKPVRRKKA